MNRTANYEKMLQEQVDAVNPETEVRLEKLDLLPHQQACGATSIVLRFACQAQNTAAIRAGRIAFERIPRRWLAMHLRMIVADSLDLTDEWEYRRLLELLQTSIPEIGTTYIENGLNSPIAEIAEAARDFSPPFK